MQLKHIDNEQEFDWGEAAPDYARYRSGYPESFYEVLAALGIGKPRQKILELGTGTGVLARAFAKRGARVTGVAISAHQIAVAQALAAQEGLDISFTTIVFAVVFWSWVLGPPGAILAVPLALSLKRITAVIPEQPPA